MGAMRARAEEGGGLLRSLRGTPLGDAYDGFVLDARGRMLDEDTLIFYDRQVARQFLDDGSV